jgi:dihydrodipicolinate synthase/N-acetylneuraminate lyase
VEIFKKYKNKQFEEAEEMFESMATLLYLEDQEIEYYIASEKEMLKYRGIIESSQSRRPCAELDKLAKKLLMEKLQMQIDKFKLGV